MTNGGSYKWRSALSLFGTPARPRGFADETLWLGRSGWVSANIRLPAKPSLVVLSVKSAPLARWRAGPLPADIGLIYLPFPADPRGSMVIRKVLPRDIPVVFVGDLDPPSIVQYVATRSGLPAATRKRLCFGGVDSAWLERIQPALRRRFSFARIRIPLSASEKRLLRRIEEATDLEALVGASAAAMLRSGFKLELEGATNPSLFRDAGTPWVFDLLRAAAKRNPSAREGRRTTR